MQRSVILVFAVFMCTISGAYAGESPALSSPDAVVKHLYDNVIHDKHEYVLSEKYFCNPQLAEIKKDQANGTLDVDPITDAQDTEHPSVVVGKPVIHGDLASVPVTFTNFGKATKFDYKMHQLKGKWKVSKISKL